jgi:hypothetical protein
VQYLEAHKIPLGINVDYEIHGQRAPDLPQRTMGLQDKIGDVALGIDFKWPFHGPAEYQQLVVGENSGQVETECRKNSTR